MKMTRAVMVHLQDSLEGGLSDDGSEGRALIADATE